MVGQSLLYFMVGKVERNNIFIKSVKSWRLSWILWRKEKEEVTGTKAQLQVHISICYLKVGRSVIIPKVKCQKHFWKHLKIISMINFDQGILFRWPFLLVKKAGIRVGENFLYWKLDGMMIISHTVTALNVMGHCYFFKIKNFLSGDPYFNFLIP